ncbi:MAG TPA: hypothetical protein PLE99_13880 [Candidatus Thiothrix moscowensis]|uniref:hypothetical protein n=1 Tax=unclassified Thiothrix TaxID=2636184 RepID=UPI001A2FBE62|nr:MULTISPECIES: hypothetical protein [unclassified Thiothrix]MBJ6609666.1 hypothetical protein [Candidatus Thiothrix moscowensis]HRJ53851.1 hypothetical protein [Candidatus Thiothrix moscowensis]HRJ93933.1 hypothetical protein [Candidatus Thiothrix moscowensis]
MQEQAQLEQAFASINALETQVQAAQENIDREHHKANITMRVVLILLGCMVLANLQFVYMLTAEFRTVIKDMVAMYEHFGRVADRMDTMAVYMQSMEQDMRLMPVMREQMALMNVRITSMSTDMGDMTQDMGNMQHQVSSMGQDMGSMSQRFHHLNSNVGGMGNDVGKMADTVP